MSLFKLYAICILVRYILAWVAYKVIRTPVRYALAVFYILLSIGSLYQYIVKTRTVGAFNNQVWWDYLRPVHALLFALTAYGLVVSYDYTYAFLLLDTTISALGFMRYHL
jgi:hypothetical protein